MPHLAFFAIERSGLAVANCLMFTMPLWTGLFSTLRGGAWRRSDTALSLLSTLGVALVARPPVLFGGGSAFSAAGCAAGLAFGAVGGALNVLIGATPLRDVSPQTLTAGQMAAAAALAVPALATRPLATWLGTAPATAECFAGLALVGALMATQSSLRALSLQRAPSPTVATILYTEIAWCLLLEVFVLKLRPRPSQFCGAALIVGGALANAAVNRRSDRLSNMKGT